MTPASDCSDSIAKGSPSCSPSTGNWLALIKTASETLRSALVKSGEMELVEGQILQPALDALKINIEFLEKHCAATSWLELAEPLATLTELLITCKDGLHSLNKNKQSSTVIETINTIYKRAIEILSKTLPVVCENTEAGKDHESIEKIATALLPVCLTSGLDFALLNVAWKHMIRLVNLLTAIPPSASLLEQLVLRLSSALKEQFDRLQLVASDKEVKKVVSLLRFFLSHLHALVKSHAHHIADLQTPRQDLICILLSLRSRTPPAPKARTFIPEVIAALQSHVSIALDAIATLMLSSPQMSIKSRTIVTADLALRDIDDHPSSTDQLLGQLQFLLIILPNWHQLRMQEVAPRGPLHALDLLLDLCSNVDQTLWLPPGTTTADDHLYWHTCISAVTATLTLLQPEQLSLFLRRLVSVFMTGPLPTALLAVDIYLHILSSLTSTPTLIQSHFYAMYEVCCSLASSRRPETRRRPLILAVTNEILDLVDKPDEIILALCAAEVKASSTTSHSLLNASIFHLLYRRINLSAALIAAAQELFDSCLARLLMSIETDLSAGAALAWDLAGAQAIAAPSLLVSLMHPFQSRIQTVLRRLFSKLDANGGYDLVAPWLAWIAGLLPLLPEQDVLFILSQTKRVLANTTNDDVLLSISRMVGAVGHIKLTSNALHDMNTHLAPLVKTVLSQASWVGQTDGLRQFVSFAKFTNRPQLVESLLPSDLHRSVVRFIQKNPAVEKRCAESELWLKTTFWALANPPHLNCNTSQETAPQICRGEKRALTTTDIAETSIGREEKKPRLDDVNQMVHLLKGMRQALLSQVDRGSLQQIEAELLSMLEVVQQHKK